MLQNLQWYNNGHCEWVYREDVLERLPGLQNKTKMKGILRSRRRRQSHQPIRPVSYWTRTSRRLQEGIESRRIEERD